MSAEVLISTMNRSSIDELLLNAKNISENCTIINQGINVGFKKVMISDDSTNIKMVNIQELGLSKSRNQALVNATQNICIVTDDDTVMHSNYAEIVNSAYEENPHADIIVFRAETFNGNFFNHKYPKNKKIVRFRDIFKVSSIEITFKRESIINKKISFNENFGLGTNYNSGEEAIFLRDALKKNLNIIFVPKTIVYHQELSTGVRFDKQLFLGKGALIFEVFGFLSFFINFIFCLKKKIEHRREFNLFEGIFYSYKGGIQYFLGNFKKRKKC